MKIENIYGDNVGYVELLDSMGDQFTPAEDARTSTNKGRLGPEKDAALQNRLSSENHTSPFEGVVIKLEIVAPLFVLREIDRHRTLSKIADDELEIVTPEESGRKWFARNEMSGRYVQLPDLYYHPVVVRGQSTTNKQGGSVDSTSISEDVSREFLERGRKLTAAARELYDWGVKSGIEKGMVRIYNTQNQYTKIRLTGSLKNWFDFLSLRLPNVVLWECRVVAEAIEKILLEKFPSPTKQWRDNVYDSIKLSRKEADALRAFLVNGIFGDKESFMLLESVDKKLRRE